MSGHGTWSLTKFKNQKNNTLKMISSEGFAYEYFVDKLNNDELVLVSVDTISGEILGLSFFLND